MPLTFEFYNSTAAPIVIGDVPVPFTVPANGSILSPGGNSETDLRQSLLVLQFSREEKLDMILNGVVIDVHKPGMAFVVASTGGGGVTSFEARTGAVVSAAGDYTAAEIDYVDTVLPAFGAVDVQGALDAVKPLLASAVTAVSATAPLTSSGGTTPDISTSMATGKLVGRSTAGTGVMEEIDPGSGLSLAGGTLSVTGGPIGYGILYAAVRGNQMQ